MSSLQLPSLEVKSFTTNLILRNFSAELRGQRNRVYRIGPAKEWSINFDVFASLITVTSYSKPKPAAKFQLSILNYKGEKYESVTSELVTLTRPNYEFRGFIKREILLKEADNLLQQDTLKILVEVCFVNDSDQSYIVQCHDSKPQKLFEAFGTLFDSKQFSDVALEADGHEFKAHKAILIARSKVFAAMFEHKMEEHKMNRVSITDIDHEVVEEMMRYMYTDEAPNLDVMAESLLAAAEKYDLENLKEMCEESLRNKITIKKAAATLLLADRYNAKGLKSHAMNFILTHVKDVMETQGWKDMITSHAYLIAEVFSALVTKQLEHLTTK